MSKAAIGMVDEGLKAYGNLVATVAYGVTFDKEGMNRSLENFVYRANEFTGKAEIWCGYTATSIAGGLAIVTSGALVKVGTVGNFQTVEGGALLADSVIGEARSALVKLGVVSGANTFFCAAVEWQKGK